MCHQGEGDQNFHIFYQCLAGASRKQRAAWHLESAPAFEYLRDDEHIASSAASAAELKQTINAMKEAGFERKQISSALQIIAAILHLGNACRDSSLLMSKEDSREVDVSVKYSAKLLGVDGRKVEQIHSQLSF